MSNYRRETVHYNRAPIGAPARLACGLKPSTITRSHRIPAEVTCLSCRRVARLYLVRRSSNGPLAEPV